MSLKPQAISPVPEETARIARSAYPKGNVYMHMRDELGSIYEDESFADLFPNNGQPLAVMLYLLGLSYGAVSLALEGLGVALCKSRVYDAVQEAAKRIPGLKRDQVFAGVRTPALGGDLTSVKCKGEWLPLGITVDSISGLALTIDALPAEDIKALQEWIEPIAKSVGANILVSDDADGFKTVADS